MKYFIYIVILALLPAIAVSQEKVSWTSDLTITEHSFKGAIPNLVDDLVQQYYFACTYDFSFHMMSMQFAFTKNFNQYVNAYYIPTHSWIESGELTSQLILMANLDFDLAELYARKFRKKLYEAKNVGSNIDFFCSLHNENNKEYTTEHAEIHSELRTVDNAEEYLHQKILEINSKIEDLSEFCKTCKPKKKKKRKN